MSALGALPSLAQNSRPPLDIWESNPRDTLKCKPVDDAFVLPVLSQKRAAAAEVLERVPFVALNERSAAGWTTNIGERKANSSFVTARRLAAVQIAMFDEWQRMVGSLPASEEERLNGLRALSAGSIDKLRPFLLRATLKYESTGGYRVRWCGDSLVIVHGSLGEGEPRSIRAPVVAFLEKAPAELVVNAHAAR